MPLAAARRRVSAAVLLVVLLRLVRVSCAVPSAEQASAGPTSAVLSSGSSPSLIPDGYTLLQPDYTLPAQCEPPAYAQPFRIPGRNSAECRAAATCAVLRYTTPKGRDYPCFKGTRTILTAAGFLNVVHEVRLESLVSICCRRAECTSKFLYRYTCHDDSCVAKCYAPQLAIPSAEMLSLEEMAEARGWGSVDGALAKGAGGVDASAATRSRRRHARRQQP